MFQMFPEYTDCNLKQGKVTNYAPHQNYSDHKHEEIFQIENVLRKILQNLHLKNYEL